MASAWWQGGARWEEWKGGGSLLLRSHLGCLQAGWLAVRLGNLWVCREIPALAWQNKVNKVTIDFCVCGSCSGTCLTHSCRDCPLAPSLLSLPCSDNGPRFCCLANNFNEGYGGYGGVRRESMGREGGGDGEMARHGSAGSRRLRLRFERYRAASTQPTHSNSWNLSLRNLTAAIAAITAIIALRQVPRFLRWPPFEEGHHPSEVHACMWPSHCHGQYWMESDERQPRTYIGLCCPEPLIKCQAHLVWR
jgi:hypothetical protein